MSETPADELLALTHALRAELGRRQNMGLRRGPAPTPTFLRPAAPPAQKPAPKPTPALPAALPEPIREPSRPPAPAPVAVEAGVKELRERAASIADLASLQAAVAECKACSLCETRTQTVFSAGQGRRVMFVGEAPGFHEDQQGEPFVGPAGQLLTDILEKGMGLQRDEVTIANVLKCRPPENRDPSPEEKALCTAWLDRQIELTDPEVIIPLGRHAANHLLGTQDSMGRLRGKVHLRGGRKVIPTYHPAFLLRSPQMKKDCWQDIQLALVELGLAPPKR
jgi:uracil-DNA glycosylase